MPTASWSAYQGRTARASTVGMLRRERANFDTGNEPDTPSAENREAGPRGASSMNERQEKEVYIVRRKAKANFTIISNELCVDTRLSWKALGLLIYLLHLPPDFKLHLYNLAKLRPGLNGRNSTRSGLRELEGLGYVTISRERNEQGRYARTVWYVTDEPEFDS